MEFSFNVQRLFGNPPNNIVRLHGRKLRLLGCSSSTRDSQFREVLDTMGKLSAKAQDLSRAISSYARFQHSDQTLYMKIEETCVIGFIKVGPKRLFISTKHGMAEIEPCCVLDFYVHESRQRHGEGLTLFQAMLEGENLKAHEMGYDRPSVKFLRFLSSRYSLNDYIPQNNNFVVFTKYFSETCRGRSSKSSTYYDGERVPSSSSSESRKSVGSQHRETQKTGDFVKTPWAVDYVNGDARPDLRRERVQIPRAIDSVAACLGLTTPAPLYRHTERTKFSTTAPTSCGYSHVRKPEFMNRWHEVYAGRPF